MTSTCFSRTSNQFQGRQNWEARQASGLTIIRQPIIYNYKVLHLKLLYRKKRSRGLALKIFFPALLNLEDNRCADIQWEDFFLPRFFLIFYLIYIFSYSNDTLHSLLQNLLVGSNLLQIHWRYNYLTYHSTLINKINYWLTNSFSYVNSQWL